MITSVKIIAHSLLIFMLFSYGQLMGQKKTVVILPQKEQIIADKKPRKIWMQNRINRDSVVNFMTKVAENYKPDNIIVVKDKELISSLTSIAKPKRVKHFETVDHSLIKNKIFKKIARKKKKIKHYSLPDNQQTASKVFEIRNKYYGDYVLVINRFRLNSKGKWNLAFRNKTFLELHYDVYDKNNNKINSSLCRNKVNLKYEMYMSAYRHLMEELLKQCLSEAGEKNNQY